MSVLAVMDRMISRLVFDTARPALAEYAEARATVEALIEAVQLLIADDLTAEQLSRRIAFGERALARAKGEQP